MNAIPKYFMVFDVESIGLHGEAYSVGWVVIDRSGKILEERCESCHPKSAIGKFDAHNWAIINALPDKCQHGTPAGIRIAFWSSWALWKEKGAWLASDCAWPVEARFLMDCVRDDFHMREWEGPYPLIDVASVMMASGMDPMGKHPRLENEEPQHNALCDARQSARLLIDAMKKTS